MRPCGATRAGTQAPPLPISTKPRGVPLPHRGYTFDSAGLASVTQPTLGNDASEEATPLGVVLFPTHCFLISSHTHNTSGAEMHRALPPPLLKIKKCVYVMIWASLWMTSFALKQVILSVSPWLNLGHCRRVYSHWDCPNRRYPNHRHHHLALQHHCPAFCHRASCRRLRVSCRHPVCRHPTAFCHPSFSSAAPRVYSGRCAR